MSKRKRVVLSLKDKVKIIESLNRGESGQMLAQIYGVGRSTISDIKINSDSIMKFVGALEKDDQRDRSSPRKIMKKCQDEYLENAVFTWFLQKRACGQHVSGPLLRERALDFNDLLGGDPNFKASSGWLSRFKSRHRIRELEILEEKLYPKLDTVNFFVNEFKDFLDTTLYDLDFVYNADETGLYWKALPSGSLASRREDAAALGLHVSKDQVTITLCANATGTHRLPLLLMGKLKDLSDLKNSNLPLTYVNQPKPWVSADTFITWYEDTFIPEVKKFQASVGKSGDVLLLLDYAPMHPSAESLSRENGKFTVMFMPYHVTSTLQPMEQGVIETLKHVYRKQLLCNLLAADNSNCEAMLKIYKEVSLKDCCNMLADAWNSMDMPTLKFAWNKLLKVTPSSIPVEPNNFCLQEIKQALKILSIGVGCDEENINEWLNCDRNDAGYQIMTDQEIVEILYAKESEVENDKEQEVKNVNEGVSDLIKQVKNVNGGVKDLIKQVKNVKEEDDDEIETEDVSEVPSHAEAFTALDLAVKWFERQEESNPTQLWQLQSIRNLAALKRTTPTPQNFTTKRSK